MSKLDRFEAWISKHSIFLTFIFGCMFALSFIQIPAEFRSGIYPKIQSIKETQESIFENQKTILERQNFILKKLDNHAHFFQDGKATYIK